MPLVAPMNRPFAFSTAALAFAAFVGVAAFAAPPAPAGSTGPSPCCAEFRFVVTGDVQHRRTPAGLAIAGAATPADFADEVYGKDFSVALPGLPEGRYTVGVSMAETYFREPGGRVFDVSAGRRSLAEGLDLAARAGFAKAYVLTAEVEHTADAIGGPLALRFEARRNNATIDAIEVRDARGAVVAHATAVDLVTLGDRAASALPAVSGPVLFRDPALPVARRVADLVRRLSLREKVEQLMDAAPPIDRLGVPGYDYWNECLHGVARAGKATVFPQAIGMAAAWDPALMRTVADTIATEARAKNNAARAADPRATPPATTGSHSGRPTSTSSATRGGAGGRRPTARTRS